jgi:undecaprenyl-diphosphatase
MRQTRLWFQKVACFVCPTNCFFLLYNNFSKLSLEEMSIFQVVILSLVEGLTEFLPVSSTGHLIVTSALMGISDDGFIKSFNIIIQFGAILSVLVLYWRRFLPNVSFYKKIFVGFLPAAIIGLAVKSKIDAILGSVTVVAWALIIGGVILILSDKILENKSPSKTVEDLSLFESLKIGFIQCFAFIPGVSRSAATILGGISLGMSRREAAEFSFFLAVPTLTGAAAIKTLGIIKTIQSDQIGLLILGTFLSFVFAALAIKFFISIVSRYGFRLFGYYRIILGIIILVWQR